MESGIENFAHRFHSGNAELGQHFAQFRFGQFHAFFQLFALAAAQLFGSGKRPVQIVGHGKNFLGKGTDDIFGVFLHFRGASLFGVFQFRIRAQIVVFQFGILRFQSLRFTVDFFRGRLDFLGQIFVVFRCLFAFVFGVMLFFILFHFSLFNFFAKRVYFLYTTFND